MLRSVSVDLTINDSSKDAVDSMRPGGGGTGITLGRTSAVLVSGALVSAVVVSVVVVSAVLVSVILVSVVFTPPYLVANSQKSVPFPHWPL